MPVYEYECDSCGIFESWNSMANRSECECPKCGDICQKVIHTPPACWMNDHDWSAENGGKGRRIGQLEEGPTKPRYFKNRAQVETECKRKGLTYELT